MVLEDHLAQQPSEPTADEAAGLKVDFRQLSVTKVAVNKRCHCTHDRPQVGLTSSRPLASWMSTSARFSAPSSRASS